MINCFIWIRDTGVFSFYLVLKRPVENFCSLGVTEVFGYICKFAEAQAV